MITMKQDQLSKRLKETIPRDITYTDGLFIIKTVTDIVKDIHDERPEKQFVDEFEPKYVNTVKMVLADLKKHCSKETSTEDFELHMIVPRFIFSKIYKEWSSKYDDDGCHAGDKDPMWLCYYYTLMYHSEDILNLQTKQDVLKACEEFNI